MTAWKSPEDLVVTAFARSSVVMMNEAHHGHRRSIRTRDTGRRILPTAHACGCGHLALEALFPEFAAEANDTRTVPAPPPHGYLAQPDLRALIQEALDLGWTLIAYEADHSRKPPEHEDHSLAATNWREREQARNLAASLPAASPLLVWCGNHHLSKRASDWVPMGYRFRELTAIDPFAIDQIQGVALSDEPDPQRVRWWEPLLPELHAYGGTAGFLVDDAPEGAPPFEGMFDAIVLSTDLTAV